MSTVNGISREARIPHQFIPAIRSSSRALVREFGFMSNTASFAGTTHPASAVHALIEISHSSSLNGPDSSTMTASKLSKILNLEKSSVSRMLRKLIEEDEVEERISGKDGREKVLHLTEKGRETVELIDTIGDKMVGRALRVLEGGANAEIVWRGIDSYAKALKIARIGAEEGTEGPIKSVSGETLPRIVSPDQAIKGQDGAQREVGEVIIKEGYTPGLLGRVVDMHMVFYNSALKLDAFFEAKISSWLAELLPRLATPQAAVWTACDTHGKILGSVFMDTASADLISLLPPTYTGRGKAHFRFFILDESLRGRGIGKILVRKAMDWVDERGLECHLWTTKGLDAARRLYDWAGFELMEEVVDARLGRELCVQRMTRVARTVEDRGLNGSETNRDIVS